jgi:hypothetical protein
MLASDILASQGAWSANITSMVAGLRGEESFDSSDED